MIELVVALVLTQPAFDVAGFTRPLELDVPSARVCRECHHRQFDEWSRSFHKASLTSPVFLDGLAAEPQRRCLICHGPLARQVEESWRTRGALVRGVRPPPESSLHEGITCSICHVRDGVVLSPRADSVPYAHPLRAEPGLRTSEFCGSCHEFSGHSVIDGATQLNSLPMQTTLSEWRAWGGAQTCQDCHMPDASHHVRGAHDEAFVRSALTLEVRNGAAIVVAHDVGHRVPTGDVFRHLVLWADDEPIARFGLELGRTVDEQGRPGVAAIADTRLSPDVPVIVKLPPATKVVRLTFHLTAPSARERPLLTQEDERFLVAEHRLRPAR